MMRIGIITYPVSHLKTQQIFFPLLERGYKIVFVQAPYTPRKKRTPVFNHRPNQNVGPDLKALSEYFNLEVRDLQEKGWWKGLDLALIGGAGIIPEEYIIHEFIINSHPGLIPALRGLDSFKWAIYDNLPVGNTLHFISKEVDKGKIITQRVTPVFMEDTLSSFAQRHYEFEINLLVNFELYLSSGIKYSLDEGVVHLRMPVEKEKLLEEKFDVWKKRYTNRKKLRDAIHRSEGTTGTHP